MTCVFGALLGFLVLGDERPARSSSDPGGPIHSPVGVQYLRALGKHAKATLAPSSGLVGALVKIPNGKHAADYGLDDVAPGIGRLRASPERVQSFGLAHPELHMEIAPPLHALNNKVGQWTNARTVHATKGIDGKGVMVGVADTGLDVTHAEMRDVNGRSRVQWMLDLSLKPLGVYPDLEKKFGLSDDSGNIIAGAVFDRDMIDGLLDDLKSGACVESATRKCAPSDESGHGTHVTGIAAASGAGSNGLYAGTAPGSDIVFVRVTRGASDGIEDDDLVRAVQFMFDRQTAENRPLVANLSLGSDFGPHDGTFLWEQTVASYVGPDHPGRAIVAAAGNSGSILETPIHQSAHVSNGGKVRVPIHTGGAASGSVEVWVTLRTGSDVKIGLEAPDGEWISPVAKGEQNGKNTDDYNAGIIYGSFADSQIPATSNSAVVVWTGKWPTGTYNIVLEGSGTAEMYLQGLGDAAAGSLTEALFVNGVREGTINLPATHPSIIGVGCTVNRVNSVSGVTGATVPLHVPVLDEAGGLANNGTFSVRDLQEGEVCWFSSAGPTVLGVPKPEISAPGAIVYSAMSRSAKPSSGNSIFNDPHCPVGPSGKPDSRCLQIDDTHALAVGTSMSTPAVAGIVALLLQKDPTLTQDKILALLQAGAHRFRGASPFNDQSSPGEVDALGSLDALEQMQSQTLQLPAADQSWVALSADYVAADASTPFTAVVELRTADGQHRADFFDQNRLQPVLMVDGTPIDPQPKLLRRGPGVFFFVWTPPPGLGGSRATFGASFDGQPIVATRTVPIATDNWTARYPSDAAGSGCNVHGVPPDASWAVLGLLLFSLRRKRS